MASNGRHVPRAMKRGFGYRVRGVLAIGVALTLASGAVTARAENDDDDDDGDSNGDSNGRYCSATASALFDSCGFEASDDYARSRALCFNIAGRMDRKSCHADAKSALQEGRQLCRAQLSARKELCGALGEGRYEPDFDPSRCQTNFINPVNPNPCFPLKVGNNWRFEGDGETIVVTVKSKSKSIEGVTCIVVNDRVLQDGVLVEDTDDWYGLRHDRTVDCCGESVRNYERFPGDNPALPELVDVDGSWKAGRDGDLPGTQFMGIPIAGAVYREEFSPGNAEDVAEVRSTTYGFGRNGELDQFAPPALVQLLCNAYNCVVTREFTPIEPGAIGFKYYAPGIGLFLEVNPRSGKVARLVDCNVDAKCDAARMLPAPCSM